MEAWDFLSWLSSMSFSTFKMRKVSCSLSTQIKPPTPAWISRGHMYVHDFLTEGSDKMVIAPYAKAASI